MGTSYTLVCVSACSVAKFLTSFLPQFHPVHVHLVDFFVIARESDEGVLTFDNYGQSGAPKDVVLVDGPKLYAIARFGPHKGEYMLVSESKILLYVWLGKPLSTIKSYAALP